jgi:hypothetical protein
MWWHTTRSVTRPTLKTMQTRTHTSSAIVNKMNPRKYFVAYWKCRTVCLPMNQWRELLVVQVKAFVKRWQKATFKLTPQGSLLIIQFRGNFHSHAPFCSERVSYQWHNIVVAWSYTRALGCGAKWQTILVRQNNEPLACHSYYILPIAPVRCSQYCQLVYKTDKLSKRNIDKHTELI